jgi:hypothetical protein
VSTELLTPEVDRQRLDELCREVERIAGLVEARSAAAGAAVADVTRAELVEIVGRAVRGDDTDYYLRLLDANVPHPRVIDLEAQE